MNIFMINNILEGLGWFNSELTLSIKICLMLQWSHFCFRHIRSSYQARSTVGWAPHWISWTSGSGLTSCAAADWQTKPRYFFTVGLPVVKLYTIGLIGPDGLNKDRGSDTI